MFDGLLHLQNGETAIYIASKNGHVKVVEMLVAHGADVNLVDEVSQLVSQ